MEIAAANTILYCDRWEETVGFYRDRLHLTVRMARPWFVEFELNGQARLSVARAADASLESGHGAGLTLSWRVEDLDALHRRLASAGVAVGPIGALWGSRRFLFFDPEGHRIECWSGGDGGQGIAR